jgi:hypothetical protein
MRRPAALPLEARGVAFGRAPFADGTQQGGFLKLQSQNGGVSIYTR